jgi:Cys-tRNA(Pro) deacylase
MGKKTPTTQALRFLDRHRVAFEAREYEHRVKGAELAAEALGWPLDAMIKTLVTALADGSFALCLLPGTAELSLKELARQAEVKSARMATVEEAERLTGYQVGGISPFGTRRELPVWIHAPLLELPRVGINGGRRGLIVFLEPAALTETLDARAADLAS